MTHHQQACELTGWLTRANELLCGQHGAVSRLSQARGLHSPLGLPNKVAAEQIVKHLQVTIGKLELCQESLEAATLLLEEADYGEN